MRLANKTALLFGSTRGIGAAIAQTFADEGANVVLTGRQVEAGKAQASHIESRGGSVLFVRCDVSEEADVQNAIATAAEHFGELTVLVNNAPPPEFGLTEVTETSNEQWHAALRTGITSVFWATKYGVPALLRSGGGSIINVSSGASTMAMPGRCAYCAAKGALNAFTLSVASEYGARAIRCNAMVLGFIAPPELLEVPGGPAEAIGAMVRERQATSQIGGPMDAAHLAVYLASDESTFLTGALIDLDGGLHAMGIDLRRMFGQQGQRDGA